MDASQDEIVSDLLAEHRALDDVVAGISGMQWDTPTPSPHWLVRDQIGHLAFFDQQAALAAASPERFVEETERDLADLAAFERDATRIGREQSGETLLDTWRSARARLHHALAEVEDGARIPWYGPAMSLRSFVTARLMETWAHGHDVLDGLGLGPEARPPTDRLRHIAFLGVSTRRWSYTVRGKGPPGGDVRVELSLPSGAIFEHGDPSCTDVVRGPAADFCLVVTQRRNFADTALDVRGLMAHEWMSIAQCFAGGPTLPPAPRGGPALTAR